MKRRLIEVGILSALPLFTLALAASYQYWSIFESDEYYRGFSTIITAAAVVVSILGIALAFYAVFDRRRMSADEEKREIEERAANFQHRMTEQAKEIELLAAMREVGLIVAREVNFEKILAGVLDVVGGVFGAENMTIFLSESEGGPGGPSVLTAKVHRAGRKILFGARVPEDVDRTGVEDAIKSHMPVRTKSEGHLDFSLPLVADRETLGVLKVSVPDEAVDERDENSMEKDMTHLVKHIALAIKTPTLYDRAVMDGLTRLYTKRHFTETLEKLFHQSARLKKPLSLIMIDIDFFKKINDTHGHISGDIILSGVADVIKRMVRRYDSVYRYGGEEIAVLLPDAKTPQAQRVARRIRKNIEEEEFISDKKETVPVTVSCGVATWTEDMKDPSRLIAAADSALYHAKEKGRNRVCTHPVKKDHDDAKIQAS